MNRDSARRVIRTFLFAFLGIALPGAFGWLNALTEWARAEGQTPFPDARSLAFIGVSAIVAGSIALLNLVWVWVEDASGKGLLRAVPPRPVKPEGGESALMILLVVVVVLIIVGLLVR